MPAFDRTSAEYVGKQYGTDENLAKRIRIHGYGRNKTRWFRFLFSLYRFRPGMRILELGCGNGRFWLENLDRLPPGCDVTLTDLSPGMYAGVQDDLEALGFALRPMSAVALEFPDASFDLVLAHHMLYHVPDRKKALGEVARVLRPGGLFAATTLSRANNGALRRIVRRFGLPVSMDTAGLTRNFGLETGRALLSRHFDRVDRIKYRNTLRVPRADAVFDYLESMNTSGRPLEDGPARAWLAAKLARDKVLVVKNVNAVFLCRKD